MTATLCTPGLTAVVGPGNLMALGDPRVASSALALARPAVTAALPPPDEAAGELEEPEEPEPPELPHATAVRATSAVIASKPTVLREFRRR